MKKVRPHLCFGGARREPVFRRRYAGQRGWPHLKPGASPVLPKGAQIAVLSGDPSKDGLYVLRLKIPANYKIAAHNHPTAEYVTVISGKFHIGMGDKLDEKKGVELRAGGFGAAPAHMNHYAWASEDTVVQVIIMACGPFAITYVNPADDPSK